MRGRRGEMEIGTKTNRLTLLRMAETNKDGLTGVFECDCEKKTIKEIPIRHIISENTTSCGCFKAENTRKIRFKHGEIDTKLYSIWVDMKRRCYNPKRKDYQWYGLLGTLVYEKWKNDFLKFKEWAMANGYNENLTIDRKNPNGHYEPDNCYWIPLSNQNDNKKKSIKITLFGETKTPKQWSKDPRCEVTADNIRSRIYRNNRSGEDLLKK